MITKIAFVAQPTTKMDEMKAFYGDTLGLGKSLEHEQWCEFVTPEGKTIALDTFAAQAPDAKPYLALESDDIEADVQKLKNAGVTVAKDVWSNDHEGVHLCKMAILADPDGNPVMLHQIAEDRR